MSYIEHIVEEYYQRLGYFVRSRLKYESSEKYGWKDIDLLAVNENEVLEIECKGAAGTHSEMAEKVVKDFTYVDKFIDDEIPLLKGKRKRHILVHTFKLSPPTVEDNLLSNGVEVKHLRDLLKEFLALLQKENQESKKKGKDEDFVTRTLRALVIYGLIKDNIQSQ